MKTTKTLAAILPIALLTGVVAAAPAAAAPAVDLPVPNHDRPAVSTDDFDLTGLDMVDDDALPQTQSLFAYLKNVGKSGNTLFGHQADATNYIIDDETSDDWSGVTSDVYNSVGDFPAVHGYGPSQVEEVQDAYRKGSIIAIEHHIANLSNGTGAEGDGGYGNVKEPNDPVAAVLPGGAKHANLVAYLDTVADFADQYVDDSGNPIPVIYRPWHELNGDWFWWTTSNATEGEYRELFRFTVDYLRDVRGVDNFIYAFSPNGHFENEEEYLYSYPGDEYVDLLGVDVYWDVPQGNPGGLDLLVKDLRIAQTYADKTGKIAALTETGIRWDASNGLKLEDAEYELNWYTDLQSRIQADPVARNIAYMLVWRNGGTDHFWVPFKGHNEFGDHEMLPDFINYYNRPEVVFASRVGDYAGLIDAEAPAATTGNAPFATIHDPVFKETTSETTRVRVYAAPGHTDAVSPEQVEATSVTVSLGGTDYPAVNAPESMFWTADVDTALVEDGRHPLTATAEYDGYTATDEHDIFVVNDAQPVEVDPYLIDDFESYDSTDDNRTDLERVWWRDGSKMNSLRLRNSDGPADSWTSRAWNSDLDTGAVLRMKYDAVGESDSQVTRQLDGADWSAAKSMSLAIQADGKGYDFTPRFVVAGEGEADSRTFEVSFNDDVSKYGYDPASTAPQQLAFDLAEFTNIETGQPATAAELASVESFSLRFIQQAGMPQMAGLNALEYYLFDDLRVSEEAVAVPTDPTDPGTDPVDPGTDPVDPGTGPGEGSGGPGSDDSGTEDPTDVGSGSAEQGDELAATGASLGIAGLIAAAFIALGGILFVLRRRTAH